MIRVKAPFSLFNGYETFPAGTMAVVSADQAKRVVCCGGDVVDGDGNPVPLNEAVRMLRMNADDLAMAEDPARRTALAAAITAYIEPQEG